MSYASFAPPRMGAVLAAAWLLAGLANPGPAAAFSLLVTPPRFELRAQPGAVLRQVIELSNVAETATRFGVQTADWTFGADGSVIFDNALAEDSCRPWTALEARELELGANGRRRYRFEVAVPSDAPARECRFAIMFEGEPERMGQLGLPVAGRIGVIVYVAVGDASAELQLAGTGRVEVNGRSLPTLTVTNTGSAHARLAGFLSGRDPSGREIVFVPEGAPVLPGQTRTLLLHPQAPAGEAAPIVSYPIRLTGRLDWSGRRLDIDENFGAE